MHIKVGPVSSLGSWAGPQHGPNPGFLGAALAEGASSGRPPGETRICAELQWVLPWWLLQCRRPGFNPWVGKIPWSREGLPTPVFWPGEFHGLYSPQGRKVGHDWEAFSFGAEKTSQTIGRRGQGASLRRLAARRPARVVQWAEQVHTAGHAPRPGSRDPKEQGRLLRNGIGSAWEPRRIRYALPVLAASGKVGFSTKNEALAVSPGAFWESQPCLLTPSPCLSQFRFLREGAPPFPVGKLAHAQRHHSR